MMLRKTSKPHERTVHKTYKQLDRIVEVQIAMHRNLVTQARGVIIFPSKAIDLFALPLCLVAEGRVGHSVTASCRNRSRLQCLGRKWGTGESKGGWRRARTPSEATWLAALGIRRVNSILPMGD